MKSHGLRFAGVLIVLVLAALACGGSFSTATISSAALSANPSGSPETAVFSPDQQTFYLLVDLSNAPDDTTIKSVWTAVEAEGVEPNFAIDETSITSGDGTVTFDLTNDGLWPTGTYQVEVYLNDELDRTLAFEVRCATHKAPRPRPADARSRAGVIPEPGFWRFEARASAQLKSRHVAPRHSPTQGNGDRPVSGLCSGHSQRCRVVRLILPRPGGATGERSRWGRSCQENRRASERSAWRVSQTNAFCVLGLQAISPKGPGGYHSGAME